MKRPTFQTVEKIQPEAILLVDKEGMYAQKLLELLPPVTPVVVVSSKKPVITSSRPVGYIPFKAGIPQIPDSYYSHIFVVYNGEKELLAIMPQFLDKARFDNAKLFFLMDLFFADPSFVQELVHSYRNSHAIIIGDIFGKDVSPNVAKTVYRFFHEANTTGKLSVRGAGLTLTFPVLFEDILKEIVRISFSQKAPKIAYGFPKHPPTELSLARLFQTINPYLRIDFVSETSHAAEGMENTQKTSHIGPMGEYLLQTNYPLLRKIKETGLLSEKPIAQKSTHPAVVAVEAIEKKETPPPPPPPLARYHMKEKRKKRSFRFPGSVLFISLFLFFTPLLITTLLAGVGLTQLLIAKDALLHGDFRKATQNASSSHTLFSLAQSTDSVVSLQGHAFGLGGYVDMLEHQLSLGTDGSFAFANVTDAAASYLAIFQKRSTSPQAEFIDASNKLKKAITIYEKVRVEQSFPGFSEFDDIVGLLSDTIDSFPSLFGFDKPKTYLVLFQNNMELRPTGGFIGSYGLLTVKDGSVSSFTVHDVYDADGQLTGHVEPSYPFRRYMGIVHQYMRDSNYDPDFPSAASVSANMLRLETNQAVDGVIAVDVSFVKALVGAVGPLTVPDYQETVTADNFYLLTQTHVEKNFFPGSTQKKDFLRSLLTALQLKLSAQKSLPYLSLGKAVTQAIAEKHVLFAFPDASIQHLFSVNNLSGSLLDSRATGTNQYNDFLQINEANTGANKANAFVYRKVDQKVTLTNGGAFVGTTTLRYKNSSTDWPGGDYKMYLRLIVPQGTQLTKVMIDGATQNITPAITDYLLYERPDFTPPPGLEVEQAAEQGKTLFGFFVIIPKGQFKTITLSYISSAKMNMTSQLVSYDLWFSKQAGTDAYPYSFVLSYPDNYKALKATKGLSVLDNSVVLERVISQDQFFHIELSRQ